MKTVVEKLMSKNLFNTDEVQILDENGNVLFCSFIELDFLMRGMTKNAMLGKEDINRDALGEICEYSDISLKLAYAKFVLEDKELTLKYIEEYLQANPKYDIAVIYSFYESNIDNNTFKLTNYISKEKSMVVQVQEELIDSNYYNVYISLRDCSLFRLQCGASRMEFDLSDLREKFIYENLINLYK